MNKGYDMLNVAGAIRYAIIVAGALAWAALAYVVLCFNN
nr:MAG TPA: hypothetical protein [Caudoviricetes sp.]